MIKIFTNKKGDLGDYLVSFYSYISLVAIILIFFALFTINPKAVSETNVGIKVDEVNINTALRNLAMVPIEFDNINWTYSDLAIFTAKERTCMEELGLGFYCNLLITNSREILKDYKEDEWLLKLYGVKEESETNFAIIVPKSSQNIKDEKCESIDLVSDFEDYQYLSLKLCTQQ